MTLSYFVSLSHFVTSFTSFISISPRKREREAKRRREVSQTSVVAVKAVSRLWVMPDKSSTWPESQSNGVSIHLHARFGKRHSTNIIRHGVLQDALSSGYPFVHEGTHTHTRFSRWLEQNQRNKCTDCNIQFDAISFYFKRTGCRMATVWWTPTRGNSMFWAGCWRTLFSSPAQTFCIAQPFQFEGWLHTQSVPACSFCAWVSCVLQRVKCRAILINSSARILIWRTAIPGANIYA